MRLDKFVSHCTSLSRRQSRIEIRAGRIAVNGNVVKDAATNISVNDSVVFEQVTLSLPGLRYFMLNKPVDVICATTDPNLPCVVDLLDDQAPGLKVAGRLDKDSTGLVLLSDDGGWIHKIISPNHACPKTYIVELDSQITEVTVERFKQGILLNGETKATAPASLETNHNGSVTVTIKEGRYHQVKRMFAACGHHVRTLHREQIGAIQLESTLLPGQYRPLTATEIASV